ncbi:unnamed protein product [Brassicogethes aeneus]|uniref:Proteasome assembly chaperone 1 n=1 Tax=Brassicogethes aeneus TaxID=1431903 RepID=A0A9P0B301_BRAAE|nr:unnamed protein product [Brassicogethes aeneus]
MLFGEIVEPSTRALIYDEEEYPNYTKVEPVWDGDSTLKNINTLLFIESNKITTLIKKFVIGDEKPIKKLNNGGLKVYNFAGDKYIVLVEEQTTYCNGEIIEILKDWISNAKSVYTVTSDSISSYQNNDMHEKPEVVLRSLTNKSNTLGCINLEIPNLVTGLGASVLSYCKHFDLSCELFVVYMDNSPLDSRNTGPVLEMVKKMGFSVLFVDPKHRFISGAKIPTMSSNLYI